MPIRSVGRETIREKHIDCALTQEILRRHERQRTALKFMFIAIAVSIFVLALGNSTLHLAPLAGVH